jgi:hypothetical protein
LGFLRKSIERPYRNEPGGPAFSPETVMPPEKLLMVTTDFIG